MWPINHGTVEGVSICLVFGNSIFLGVLTENQINPGYIINVS